MLAKVTNAHVKVESHPCRAPCVTSLRPVDSYSRRLQCHAHNPVSLPSPSSVQKPASDPPPTPESSRSEGQQHGFWSVVSSSQAFAQQLLSHFSKWPGAQMQQAEKVLQEASNKEKEKELNSVPADITPYLHDVAVWEMKHIRKLSHLCAITYKPYKVTETHIKRFHNLDLVTCSWKWPLPFETTTPEEALAEGDGMAVSVEDVHKIYKDGQQPSDIEEPPAASHSSSSPGDLVAALPAVVVSGLVPAALQGKKWASPADAVTAKLAEAAMAASAAAAAAATPLASAAGSLYAGLASLPIPSLGGGSSNSSSSSSEGRSSEGTKPAASVSQTLLATSLANAVLAEAQKHSSSGNGKSTAQASQLATATPSNASAANPPYLAISPNAIATTSACPSEWFVCDDHAHHLRIFVIQGSDTIDHWKLNLTFDPVVFEDPALGVTVHRGVYEAAMVLYQKLLPLVYEHLDSSPFARVTFTGHSIGGCLAVLLMLMYKKRKVLTPSSIATVYTFGAPSVFCEGVNRPFMLSSTGSADSSDVDDGFLPGSEPPSMGGPSRLLAALDLKDNIIRNVIMHRDIVPRAFACDYSLVADILKGWSSFRDHSYLYLDGRKLLYCFIGRMIVLQPEASLNFVSGDPDHPLLPPGPGMYYLAEPSEMHVGPASTVRVASTRGAVSSYKPTSSTGTTTAVGTASDRNGNGQDNGQGMPEEKEVSTSGQQQDLSLQASASGNSAITVPQPQEQQSLSTSSREQPPSQLPAKVPSTAREALLELLDCPHPLTTLADPAAYLEKGSISRYHNPDHYTQAFGQIIHVRRQHEPSSPRKRAAWKLQRSPEYLKRVAAGLKGEESRGEASLWDSSDASAASAALAMELSRYS